MFFVFLYFFIPVQNGAFKGDWFVIGDTNSSGTLWKINWFNKATPDRYWDNDPNHISLTYNISEENGEIVIRESDNIKREVFRGKITSFSPDTIHLGPVDTAHSFNNYLTFIKLNSKTKTKFSLNKVESFLENKTWVFHNGDFDHRLDFKNKRLFDSLGSKMVSYRSTDNHWNDPYSVWAINSFNEQYILSIYLRDYFEELHFFIDELYTDSMEGRLAWGQNFSRFKMKQIPENLRKDTIIDLLVSKKWVINESKQLKQNYTTAAPNPYYHQNGDYDLNLYDLERELVSFEFTNDGKFKLYKNSLLLFENTWEISSDGKYIFINDRFTPHIEIIELSENNFEVRMDLMVFGEKDIVKYSYQIDEPSIEFEYGMFYRVLFQLKAQWP